MKNLMNTKVLGLLPCPLLCPHYPDILFPELVNGRLDLFVTFFHLPNNMFLEKLASTALTPQASTNEVHEERD